MNKKSNYQAKQTHTNGYINYDEHEHETWHILFERQTKLLAGRACDSFIQGLKKLELDSNTIPQAKTLSNKLKKMTGWEVQPVPALINFKEFFQLLSEKRFPAASFIRKREELDYLKEPDIFHEIYGHCPLLTAPNFADFTHNYGKFGLAAKKEDRALLARLYWFTVEFGLLETESGLRSYGAGINSSPGEIKYALESPEPDRKPFDPIKALRTPYRIDIFQPIYFILQQPDQLYELSKINLQNLLNTAKSLGDYKLGFPSK